MEVTKRNGETQAFDSSKILRRILALCNGYGRIPKISTVNVKPDNIVKEIEERIPHNATTCDIDEMVAQGCASNMSVHPDFGSLASRVFVNNLHKETPDSFSQCIEILYRHHDHLGVACPLINEELYQLVQKHKNEIDSMIAHERDYNLDYFGLMTLHRAYLLRTHNKIVERPQYLWMRVALAIHGENLERAFQSYNFMTNKYFTHATPTLFHAGTPRQQLSSCFLVGSEDRVQEIFKTVSDVAMISKWAGGVGVHLSNIRADGSYIRSTGRYSDGIMPLMKVLNATARYINQSGRRNGSFAIYLEPWHSDIFTFLEAKKNRGNEEERARDLFYALWVPDLFMKRVQNDEMWSLMCPDECPNLPYTHSEEFETLYTQYESEKKYKRQVKARDLFREIINSQIETGTPYMLYKDACNQKSNQSNLGTIRSSNLCAEIIEYSDSKEYAVCNLASIALQNFIKQVGEEMVYDFALLEKVVGIAVENLDKVIDINHYPTPETKLSNERHRPIGIGVQGLADAYIMMGYSFDSPEAHTLNQQIFETIYYAALSKSHELAVELGAYSSFEGCPLSRGQFQFDLWGKPPALTKESGGRYDWEALRSKIMADGIRNSQLIALMPTASTSQILGSNECFEPYTSNIYMRRTLAGEFTVVNKYLVNHLIRLGLWNSEMHAEIIKNRGSIQAIPQIPQEIRNIYKTAWELKQKTLLQQAAERGVFVCQSQSLNVFVEKPRFEILYSIHMYGWKLGLKTGSYYLRTKPAADMQAFTVAPTTQAFVKVEAEDATPESGGGGAGGGAGGSAGTAQESTTATTDTTATSDTSETKESKPGVVKTVGGKTFVCYEEEGCLMCGS